MDQIMSLATGIVGTKLMIACTLGGTQPSIVIYNVGTLVYVMGEITGGKAQGDFIKKQNEDIKMVEEKMRKTVEGGDVQKAAIEAALKDEKQILEFIKKRKKMLSTVGLVYKAAVAAAIIEFILSKVPPFKPDFAACKPVIAMSKPVVMAVSAAFGYISSQGKPGGIITTGATLIGAMMLILNVGTELLDKLIPMMYSFAPARIISFGVSMALMNKLKGDMSKKQQIAEENVAKLEKVLAAFNKDTAPSGGLEEGTTTPGTTAPGLASTSAGGSNSNTNSAAANTYNITKLPDSQTAETNCVSSSSEGVEFSQKSCASPLKITAPQFDAQLNLPTLTAATTAATDLGNAIASGNTAAADAASNKLEALSANLDQVQTNLMKQANDTIVAQGGKAIDFEKEIEAELGRLESKMDSSLSSNGVTLASSGNASGSEASLDQSKKPKSEEEMKIEAANASSTIDFSNASAATYQNTAATMPKISEGLDGTEYGADAQKTASLSESLGNYEASESEISNNVDVSLFKQVSNRYLMNYQRLFKRKQIVPQP